MIDLFQINRLVLELKRALESAAWTAQEAPELEAKGARAYGGTGDSWHFLVVVFDGDRAAGTATRDAQIVFLTPELADRAAELAQRERSER